MLREQWVARPGVLESLDDSFASPIHRPSQWEAELTLKRFAPNLVFDPIIGMDEVRNHKPAPDGLLQIRKRCREFFYVGDTVDDARCAKSAGVRFIGVAAPSNPSTSIWSSCLSRKRLRHCRRH